MLSKEFIQKMQKRLQEEKQVLEAKIKELKEPEQPMDNPDLDDLGLDAREDIMEENLLGVHEFTLGKVDAALNRIKDGTYGKCPECGKEWTEEQLEKVPWANRCPQCREDK